MKDTETYTHIIYHIAKQMKQENKGIVGKRCIWDDNGVLTFSEEYKERA